MLSSLGVDILEYWKENKPQMVKAFQHKGILDEMVDDMTRRVGNIEIDALRAGMSDDQARELGRAEYMPELDQIDWSIL